MEDESNSGTNSGRTDLTEDIRDYLNVRMQIMRLNITEKISGALAGFITGVAVIILYLLVLLCFTISLSLWIGSLIDNTIVGFLCVGGFYLIIAIVFRMISNRSLKPKLTDRFIADFSNDD